jgi:hypothetical protein
MSTDWNIKCLDCDDTHYFNDANCCDEEMAVLVKHAAAIAALRPLVSEFGRRGYTLELSFSHGRVDVDWFAAHAGHRLAPISEYGHFMDQCHEYVECVCGSMKRCTRLPGHDGPHDATPRPLGEKPAAANGGA